MTTYATPPIDPFRISSDTAAGTMTPAGPLLPRRLPDLEGLFRDVEAWRADRAADDRVVYTVASTPVPETPRELPQSVTTINPGACGGEFYMTKGHQHPDPQGEIYLGLSGVGGLLLFDGERPQWIDMEPGVIGYIPPGWGPSQRQRGRRALQVPSGLPPGARTTTTSGSSTTAWGCAPCASPPVTT